MLCGSALTHNALEEREHGGVALCLQGGQTRSGKILGRRASTSFARQEKSFEQEEPIRGRRRSKADMEASQFVPFKFLLKADGPKVVADLFVACYAQRFAKPYPAQLLEAASTALKISQTEADQVCVT